MEEYIVMIDSDGRPYIEHGVADRAHKYIMKIGEGAKARYFYTQEQIRAYQREKALINAMKDVQKNNEKISKKADKAAKKIQKKNERTVEKKNKELHKIGEKAFKQHEKDEREFQKKTEQLHKIADKAFKQYEYDQTHNKVSVADYLTGGSEAKEYRAAKKEVRKTKRDLKDQNKVANYYDKTHAQERAKAERRGIDVFGQEKKYRNLSEQTHKEIKETEKKLEDLINKRSEAEIEFESTSLPGQTHRVVRKGKEKVAQMLKKFGTTPVVSVKKSTR